MIRMGNVPDGSFIPNFFNNDVWELFNQVMCNQPCTFTPVITGSPVVCANDPQIYSVPAVAGSSYVWTVAGGNIVSGQGTNQISVLWNNGVAGTVSIVQETP